MTPQELKNSILQLAIQGKLVEQRPEEGTAEELFAQIQEEKQRLIAEKKIKKEKPLPEITEDEKPFDIPESWKWVRFGEIFDITMGQSPKGTSVSKNGDGMEFHQGKIYFGIDYFSVYKRCRWGQNYIDEVDQMSTIDMFLPHFIPLGCEGSRGSHLTTRPQGLSHEPRRPTGQGQACPHR